MTAKRVQINIFTVRYGLFCGDKYPIDSYQGLVCRCVFCFFEQRSFIKHCYHDRRLTIEKLREVSDRCYLWPMHHQLGSILVVLGYLLSFSQIKILHNEKCVLLILTFIGFYEVWGAFSLLFSGFLLLLMLFIQY